MYIIELFFKIKENLSNRTKNNFKKTEITDDVSDNYEKCEHIFVPIDSTNTVLGCNKCGFIIHVNPEDLKKKNFFENNL